MERAGESAFLAPRTCRGPWSPAVILARVVAVSQIGLELEFKFVRGAKICQASSATKEKLLLYLAFSFLRKAWGMGAFFHESS